MQLKLSSNPRLTPLSQGLDGTTSPLGRPLTTPIPPSDVSQQSSDSETGTGAKDENGQEICCIVCNDKSSGKHYGQFTCEGKSAWTNCAK